jgi:hypothetical protein
MMNIEQGILNVEVMQHPTSTFKIPCSIFNIPYSANIPTGLPISPYETPNSKLPTFQYLCARYEI